MKGEKKCDSKSKQNGKNQTTREQRNSGSGEIVQRSVKSTQRVDVGHRSGSRWEARQDPTTNAWRLTRKHGTAAAAQGSPTTLVMRRGRVHVACTSGGRGRTATQEMTARPDGRGAERRKGEDDMMRLLMRSEQSPRLTGAEPVTLGLAELGRR